MTGFTITEHETSLLGDIADSCRTAGPDPVAWRALDDLRELLHSDWISFNHLDTGTSPPRHVFLQELVEGERGTLRDEPPAAAAVEPFWLGYWRGDCSYPDRTGDFASITTLADFSSHAAVREIMACIPLRPGHQLRLLAWRETSSPDYTDHERFYLDLIRPHLAAAHARWARQHPMIEGLTERQVAVLSLVRDGLTNSQVAHRLGLSEGTVRTHLNHIHERLGVTSRTSAVQAVFAS